MELRFPLLGGGTVSGLNDAGIETFEGDFAKNVVRECAQNSLDAAVGKPVSLRIQRCVLSLDDLPFIPRLREVLQACRSYWHANAKAVRFFDLALQSTADQSIDALRVSDSNTTGLDGTDDDIEGRWFALVKSRGVSNQKDAQSGGAFGIGKDAPLAGSACRTVLYSTRTHSNAVAFQGVCRLVTHKNTEGQDTQGTGFIGIYEPVGPIFRAIRDETMIPRRFLRPGPGLDVWILGCRLFEDGWDAPFVRSALAHFWPAIHGGLIEFVIGDHRIDEGNLGSWMQKERHDNGVEEAFPFYRSLVDPSARRFETTLPTAGECRLHLLLSKPDLPKRVCLVRATGMVIDDYAPRVGLLPFSGLFVCTDPDGNRLLRSLEPPRHDKWDSKREGEPGAKKALSEIREWIREILKKQIPHLDEDQFNETDVPPELQEEDPSLPPPDDQNERNNEPDLGGKPLDATKPRSLTPPIIAKKKTAGTLGTTDIAGNIEDPADGDGQNTGGKRGRHDEGPGTTRIAQTIQLQLRAFPISSAQDEYDLFLRANQDYSGTIRIEVIGDDSSAEALDVRQAESDGNALPVRGGTIGAIRLTANETSRVKVWLRTPGKYALRASVL